MRWPEPRPRVGLRSAYGPALAQHNMSVISDSVPTKTFLDCGLDLDRRFPLPPRMIGTTRFMLTHHREREHHRQSLDNIARGLMFAADR